METRTDHDSSRFAIPPCLARDPAHSHSPRNGLRFLPRHVLYARAGPVPDAVRPGGLHPPAKAPRAAVPAAVPVACAAQSLFREGGTGNFLGHIPVRTGRGTGPWQSCRLDS